MPFESGDKFGTANFSQEQAYQMQKGFNKLLVDSKVKDEAGMANMVPKSAEQQVKQQ